MLETYRRIRAVVFDLDGTLVHTTVDFSLMKKRLLEDLRTDGIPPEVLDLSVPVVENVARVESYLMQSGRGDEVSLLEAKVTDLMNRTELERVEHTTIVAGSMETLTQLKMWGYQLGLLTRGSRQYTLAALDAAGLNWRFDAMICRDDFAASEAKPNGKAMIRMAHLLSVPTIECLLVGDHTIDLECARSSGAHFTGVLTGAYTKDDWSRRGCPNIIESVSEIPRLLRPDMNV